MENEHKHHVIAWWTSGQAGIAKSDSAPNAIHFTAPPEFGGLEGRWTPEDLLMTALASCFTTTFHAIAGCSNEEQREWAISLLDKAKALCLVSRALATTQKFEARVDICKHSHQSEDRGIHVC
jgi:organic hydroperoxide reductase OsmC/OhrA